MEVQGNNSKGFPLENDVVTSAIELASIMVPSDKRVEFFFYIMKISCVEK